jgi:hypothetical protein
VKDLHKVEQCCNFNLYGYRRFLDRGPGSPFNRYG